MIYEAVIITRNEDGSNQIAPLGYQEIDGFIVLSPFRPSTTLANLERTNQAVINLTDNVAVIAGCLTGHYEWPTVDAKEIDGARLEDTLAHMELEVDHIEENEVRPRFFCKIKHHENHKSYKGFNRAKSAVLEAAILTSRLHMLSDDKIDTEIQYLKISIDKTAGNQELEAWGWLMDKIDSFREQLDKKEGRSKN
ncbi:MAG: DUF447 domain-containing protein [Gammaproteobacteria bacterium]